MLKNVSIVGGYQYQRYRSPPKSLQKIEPRTPHTDRNFASYSVRGIEMFLRFLCEGRHPQRFCEKISLQFVRQVNLSSIPGLMHNTGVDLAAPMKFLSHNSKRQSVVVFYTCTLYFRYWISIQWPSKVLTVQANWWTEGGHVYPISYWLYIRKLPCLGYLQWWTVLFQVGSVRAVRASVPLEDLMNNGVIEGISSRIKCC